MEKQKRFCYYICPSQITTEHGGFVPSLVREGEAGYCPMTGSGGDCSQPWVWGKTLEEAEIIAAKYNSRQLGLSEEDVRDIIVSSMFAR